MAGDALKARASTPLGHHPLGEGNLGVVLLEGVQDLPAQLTGYAEIGQPTSPPRPRCGGGRRRLRGDHRGGSGLLQACDELKVVVSRHPTWRLSLQSHKWLGLR
jgi:hypothetical protein